jgi:hypothetical protein
MNECYKKLVYTYMQNISKVRILTINALEKAFNNTRVLVDELAKKSKQDNTMALVQLKLNNLELYINALKTLEAHKITGGSKTRKNSRK